MTKRLTDRMLKTLAAPATGNRIAYDSDIKGLGLRITASGNRSFILNYRIDGRERRYTIGPYGEYTLLHARKRAGELRRMVERGEDPLGQRVDARTAPTIADMCQRFCEDHLPKLRPKTREEYEAIINTRILPAMKHLKVDAVTFSDVDDLHRKITKSAPYRANRMVNVLSKMFSLSMRWGWRTDNPCVGVERNQEAKRHRYLSVDEIARLSTALAEHPDQQAANIIRLLLLTGARRGEVQGARWDQLDLATGVWTKPGATTKQKTEHRVPLSAPAMQLLVELRNKADDDADWVFPSHGKTGHRVELARHWARICKAAKIKNARLHDLRHSFASMLVSSGLSLPIIGSLLGHTQAQTTARYAHLADDPLRAATERVGALISGQPSAEIIPLKRRK